MKKRISIPVIVELSFEEDNEYDFLSYAIAIRDALDTGLRVEALEATWSIKFPGPEPESQEFDGERADDEMGRGINMEEEGRRPRDPRSLL
jgi:hypothetical protein